MVAIECSFNKSEVGILSGMYIIKQRNELFVLFVHSVYYGDGHGFYYKAMICANKGKAIFRIAQLVFHFNEL